MRKKSRERFEEIVKVFAKYGFGYVVDSTINNNKNSPSNFRKAIEELGPTFVKIARIGFIFSPLIFIFLFPLVT